MPTRPMESGMATAERTISDGVEVHELSQEDGRALLDALAQRYLGMTGAAFIEAWDRGEFREDPDRPEVTRVAMLLPLGR
jgi:hypothetical protein